MISYEQFLQWVPKLKNLEAPGAESQLKMAALERLEELQSVGLEKNTPKKAAVMMYVYPKNNEAHFVLIERQKSKGKHSGQIAFPGGKTEPDDNGFEDTALRETFEEVGVPYEFQEIIIEGTPLYIPPSNYLVYNYLAYYPHKQLDFNGKKELDTNNFLSFTPQIEEVKSIIEVPLSEFLETSDSDRVVLSTSYMTEVSVPCYRLQGNIVWGATAMMLSEYKVLMRQIINK
ncbi:CoA pyrophosphatase [Nonlabens tegetincola]|uniref:NUDIX hydrolase n=1 Tax=Nonlabens tegetincola TaxID=323273 RepID=UPI0030C83568